MIRKFDENIDSDHVEDDPNPPNSVIYFLTSDFVFAPACECTYRYRVCIEVKLCYCKWCENQMIKSAKWHHVCWQIEFIGSWNPNGLRIYIQNILERQQWISHGKRNRRSPNYIYTAISNIIGATEFKIWNWNTPGKIVPYWLLERLHWHN